MNVNFKIFHFYFMNMTGSVKMIENMRQQQQHN